jgi:hypothetical protein
MVDIIITSRTIALTVASLILKKDFIAQHL